MPPPQIACHQMASGVKLGTEPNDTPDICDQLKLQPERANLHLVDHQRAAAENAFDSVKMGFDFVLLERAK
jgi:hypothetical protein